MSKSYKKFSGRPKVTVPADDSIKNKLRSIKAELNNDAEKDYDDLNLEEFEDDNFEKFTKKR